MTSPYGHPFSQTLADGSVCRERKPFRTACRVASTADIGDLSAASVSQDGETLIAGERILVWQQTDPIENGIYGVGVVSAGVAALTRLWPLSDDAAYTDNTFGCMLVGVEEGSTYGGNLFILTSVDPVVGTDAINFAQIATAGAVIGASKRSAQIQHSDLTDADGSQTLNIGAVLPANARILGAEIVLATAFSGGGAGAVTVDVGGTDADCLIDGANVFTGAPAANGSPLGINPSGNLGGQQLTATVAADVNVADLTAGNMTITVTYFVLA